MSRKTDRISVYNSSMLSSQSSVTSTPAATASGPGRLKKHAKTQPGKKFATRAEEFCAFITSLGYQISKYTKAEHYDYIFQDEETAKIARLMMKEIGPKNILDQEDINRFNKLKADGRVLYGIDLEEALERRKCREIQRARLDQAVIDKDKELDRLIAEKQEQIRQIKSIDNVLSEVILQREVGAVLSKTKEDLQQNHSEHLDREIQAKKEDIMKLTEMLQSRLKSIHLNISSGCDLEKQIRLCDMDWLKMLEEEDKLNAMVKSMFDKYGTDLIRQEIGGRDLGAGDVFANPVEAEAMYRMFSQHEKHLERLKHVIIYEKMQEIDMDIEMAGCQAALGNMSKIIEEVELISQADSVIQSRMLRDMQQTNETLESTFQREKIDLLDVERQDETERLNAEVKEIVDMRSRAKKNLHELFAFLINILVHQRVRVDLIRELVRAERTKNEHFAWKLHDYRNSVLRLAQKEESIYSELNGQSNIEPELLECFNKYGIPLLSYQNPLTSYQALLAVQSHSAAEKELNDRKEEEEYQLKKTRMFQQINHLQVLAQNLKRQTTEKTPMEKVMSELDLVHRDMESKLKRHELHKEQLAKDAIAKKMDLVKAVQGMVAQYNASKDQCQSPNRVSSDSGTSVVFPVTNH